MESTGSKRPSEWSIAFALSIVRSKPPELSVREYILRLRQHVANGRRENALSSAYRHLDRSSYWRSEAEREQKARKAVEDENTDLQRELALLKAKLETSTPDTASKKRKNTTAKGPRVLGSQKRLKTGTLENAQSLFPGWDIDFELSNHGHPRDVLVRNWYRLYSILECSATLDVTALSYYLVQTVSAIPQILEETIERCSNDNKADVSELKNVCDVSDKTLSMITSGLGRVNQLDQNGASSGCVLHSLLQMFYNIVTQLSNSALEEARTALKARPSSSAKEKAAVSRTRTRQPKTAPAAEDTIVTLLTRLLGSFVDMLDPDNQTHNSLFEGISYFVLEAVGPRLYALVFEQPRGKTIQEEIDNSYGYGEGKANATKSIQAAQHLDIEAAKVEAPFLIHLLGRIMSAAPAHLGTELTKKTGMPMQARGRGSTKGILTVAARERLQRTLVNCAFGTEGVNKGSLFHDCLKKPSLKAAVPLPAPRHKSADMKEWFTEEVWRLLGWEILARDEEGDDFVE